MSLGPLLFLARRFVDESALLYFCSHCIRSNSYCFFRVIFVDTSKRLKLIVSLFNSAVYGTLLLFTLRLIYDLINYDKTITCSMYVHSKRDGLSVTCTCFDAVSFCCRILHRLVGNPTQLRTVDNQ